VTIQLASAIVGQLGPVRIAVETPGVPTLARELALLGCEVTGGNATAVVIECAGPDPQHLLSSLAAFDSTDALVLIAKGSDLPLLEASVFASGWRRTPGAAMSSIMALLQRDDASHACFYERAPRGYSGMLNRSDEIAITSVGRWSWGAGTVRAGDRILLLGPDAEEGRIVLEAVSRAAEVVAGSEASDGYAERHFDLVIALDAPGAWDRNIGRFTRLLKLDGRLVIGWPESSLHGPDDWATLEEALTNDFLLEGRLAQADREVAPQPVPLDDSYRPGWQIAVVMMNPIGGEAERETYIHPAFGRSHATVVDFAGGYENPWLYRVMVQMGERLTDDAKLARLAEYVAVNARPGSADQGAALSVLGYRVLENRADNVVPMLLGAIEAYCGRDGDQPHVVRWRVSLAFLAGRLSELVGDREAAKLWYGRAAGDDWKRFSNILATKAISAAFFVGRISLAGNDPTAAWSWFQRGVDIALGAAGADHRKELGAGEGLLPFYLPELAEVIDMGSQCANALANRHLWERNPGLFWRQVDVKRFGLASWAIDMAKENARLRQIIAHV